MAPTTPRGDEIQLAGGGGQTPAPVVMGILNVTPDSFSDGGEFFDKEAGAARAAEMLDEGAGIVDVGGESTRPGSDPVPAEEEARRVVPVIREILAARPGAVISIDTYHAATAEAALEAGAGLVNDVTALNGDPRMADVVAGAGCPVVLMHMLGEPKTMQQSPHYDDVVSEVREFLARRAEAAISAGISPEDVILDPGIGFGKNLEHNLALVENLDAIADLGYPVLFGASRKSFIGRLSDGASSEAGDRVFGTVAASVLAYERGATIFRVHDVRANREALEVAAAISGSGSSGSVS
ncbi:dihydropteroate synthase [Rubrobacter aplysinae]|uniref:dihydropteroate synthase n=1 Tax=Rubrobacter aplysinae TaxID=909625 RepID=UPI000AD9AE1A|nr:dihydropteroate synthase [Rubrobacter aplysinae]